MAHAEKCPICLGSGKITDWSRFEESKRATNGLESIESPCHGCNGKGWIEVRDEIEPNAVNDYGDPIKISVG